MSTPIIREKQLTPNSTLYLNIYSSNEEGGRKRKPEVTNHPLLHSLELVDQHRLPVGVPRCLDNCCHGNQLLHQLLLSGELGTYPLTEEDVQCLGHVPIANSVPLPRCRC